MLRGQSSVGLAGAELGQFWDTALVTLLDIK